MSKKNNYNHKPGIIKVKTSDVRFGGQYAAMQQAIAQEKQKTRQPIQEEKRKTYKPIQEETRPDSKRQKYIESIKDSIKRSHYYWMCICLDYDSYGLTESEYVDIAKFAIDLYPTQLNRVLDKIISANDYYEICKVMAKRGYFLFVKYEKLKQAKINGMQDPVFDIVQIAIENCRGSDHLDFTWTEIIKFLKQYDMKMLSMIGRTQNSGR